MAFFREGDIVPEVTCPIGLPAASVTGYPCRAMPLSMSSNPTSRRATPCSFCCFRSGLSMNSLVNLVIYPKPASMGEVVSSMSFP